MNYPEVEVCVECLEESDELDEEGVCAECNQHFDNEAAMREDELLSGLKHCEEGKKSMLAIEETGSLADHLEDDGNDVYTCAGCGSVWTHQLATAVFTRKEDAPVERTIIPSVTDSTEWTEGDVSRWDPKCPSTRRDGLCILLKCEESHCLTEIHIYQHKGRTFTDAKNLGLSSTAQG